MIQVDKISRREALVAIAGLASGGAATSARPAELAPGKTFVLAHGSWHGGWCWARIADRLRGQGHHVFTPSYTGMGDRAHLLSKDITLETFIQDISQVLVTEELSEVILVGHSFGGVPISGVADRMPEKIRHLVYLDAVVLESGKSAFSVYPPEEAEERIAAANRANGGLAVPIPKSLPPSWGFTAGSADYDWVMRRITPTPLRAYTTTLKLHAPIGNGRPKTYIHCAQPDTVLDDSRALVKSLRGWNWIDFPGPHDGMITRPDAVAKLLLQI
jgi:pimeloyl-ACP methyl ester carboxylesterase